MTDLVLYLMIGFNIAVVFRLYILSRDNEILGRSISEIWSVFAQQAKVPSAHLAIKVLEEKLSRGLGKSDLRLLVQRNWLKRLSKDYDKLEGELNQRTIQAKVSEKTAERAFNLASASNLGVLALQKSLQIPRPMTKQQGTRNLLAKKEVDALFSNEGIYDYLRPTLDPEENEALDQFLEDKEKMTNGEPS